MMALPPHEARRAALCAGLLASDHDGEVVNAARSLCGLLRKGGLEPSEVIAAGLLGQEKSVGERQGPSFKRPWRERARMASYSPNVTPWEREFLASIVNRSALTERQESTLRAILRKAEGGRG
jgi:hypothetical protein